MSNFIQDISGNETNLLYPRKKSFGVFMKSTFIAILKILSLSRERWIQIKLKVWLLLKTRTIQTLNLNLL